MKGSIKKLKNKISLIMVSKAIKNDSENILDRILHPEDKIIEIGINFGIRGIYAKRKIPSLTLISYEVNPFWLQFHPFLFLHL